jgi:pectin methylesterase-like acyl-CoA thioesterase
MLYIKIKPLASCLLILLSLLKTPVLYAQQPAFPGAEGAGMFTTGGRGTATTPTTVFEVTNLLDDGQVGSLRYALTAPATYRTVVFRVSGTIHLNSGLSIKANTTIAGQTAPGDGICVADHSVHISGDNVIVRYMRFRLGDKNQKKLDANGNPVDGSGGDDAFGGTGPSNVIIDHITASWSNDEALTIYRGDNLTIQWCMISEPLNYSYHFETGDTDYERHGYGGIWGAKRGSMHHNLIAHCRNRNPRFAGINTYTPSTIGIENVDFRNNVLYNWGINTVYGGEGGNYNVVNNYYKYGPNTGNGVKYRICNPSNSATVPVGKWYVNGNYVDGSPANTADNSAGVSAANPAEALVATPFNHGYPINTEPAVDAFEAVLQRAGCTLPGRDTLDQRIINDVRNRTGGIIDVQGGYPHGTPYSQTVNAWPALTALPAPADSDHDGMPDSYENANGLNSNDAADRNGYAANGYTNLENYLNSLTNAAAGTTPVVYAHAVFNSFSQTVGSPAALQSMVVSGANLSSAITITAPLNYQLSSDSSNWSAAIILNATSGRVASTRIHVRLNAAASGSYSGSILMESNGASTLNFAVSGITTNLESRLKQVLGFFPAMEGGFENQAAGSVLTTAPGAGVNLSQIVWTTSGSANIIKNGTARTGDNYFTYTSTSGSTKNVYSPSVTASNFVKNTKYIVQYYYRGRDPAGGNAVSGLLAVADSTNFSTAYTTLPFAGTGNAWLKVANAYSINPAYTPAISYGGLRFNGGGTAITMPFDVDDFVVYPADDQANSSADITAPGAVTGAVAAAGSNGAIAVSWAAPAGGVDGGGYLVLRSTSDSAVPSLKANGIYSVGNSAGAGNVVVYIGTTNAFTDNGNVAPIHADTTYTYYIFTVDKAFNYSAAAIASATVRVPVSTVSLTGSLHNFNQTVGTPSVSQVFRLLGNNLQGKVAIAAPAGFELSEDSSSWSASLLLTPENNSVDVNVFLRLNTVAAGNYGGGVIASVNGVAADTLTVNGAATAVLQVKVYTADNSDAVVAQDGSGNYSSLQAAIDAAPTGRTTPYVIFIKKGRYLEKIKIPSNKPFIHLIGESVANTIISWDAYSGKIENGVPIGTNTSATLTVNADDFFMMSITVENSTGYTGDGPQAVAVYISGDRCAYKNCRFIGGQDTLWHNGNGRHYFKNCYIDGNTDFIFGSSTAVFDSCVIHPRDRIDGGGGGFITAGNTSADKAYGEVFRDCMLTKNRGVTSYSLGRPWQNAPKTVYLNTMMGSSINPSGWSTWNVDTSLITYAEYRSKQYDNSPVDVSKRVSWSRQLTDTEAAAYYNNPGLFGNWDPFLAFPAINAPVTKSLAVANFRAQRSGANSMLSWNLCWPMSGVTYELYRSTDSIHYTKTAGVTGTVDSVVAFSITDALPAKGTIYYYYVKASKTGYPSDNSYVAIVDPAIPLNGEMRSRGSGGWTNNVSALTTITGGVVTGVAITSSPTDYTSAPVVTFGAAPSGGTTATGTAILTKGVVTGVTITHPGSGYTAAPSVSFSTTGTGGNSIWEKYNSTTKTWEIVPLGTGASGTVTISAGDTIALNSLVGINNLMIDPGAVFQTDGQNRNIRIKGDVNNAGIFGGVNSDFNKITLELDGANGVYNIVGNGLYNFGTLRTLTAVENLTVNINANLTLNQNLQAWYGSGSATNYGGNNVTINIGRGYIVKASVLHSASTTNTTASFGRYTYNINGTLDLSNSSAVSGLIPHASATESIVTLNVNGVLKTGSQFRTVSTAPGASSGKVVLTIGDGGLIDATKAGEGFAIAPNYFVVSGNGSLKRTVGGTAVLFPIGVSSGSYSPVTFTNIGTVDNFSVTVKNSFDHPVPDTNRVVKKQWRITEEVAGGSQVTAKFGWHTADQAVSFDPTQLLAVMQYDSSTWKVKPATTGGSGTLADLYTATVSGLTAFSVFGVENYTKTNATLHIENNTSTYDGNMHGATGFAYGADGVDDKQAPDPTFIYKDSNNVVLGSLPRNAGTYKVTALFAGNDYYLPDTATAVLVINPAMLTVKANDRVKECGAELTLGTIDFVTDGPAPGDTVAGVTLSSGGAAIGAQTGTYVIVPGDAQGAGLFNYRITYVNGTLIVKDNTMPAITWCPVVPALQYNATDQYTIPALTATDNCGIADISYTINGATSRSGTGDASGQFNVGASTINWIVSDGSGNKTTGITHVVVNPPMCGKDKVIVCHKGKAICISKDAAQAHLNHGDHWGECNAAQLVAFDKPGKRWQVKVYPNPVHNDLTVYVDKIESGATVELFATGGLLVRSAKLTSHPQTISVKGLPPGVYFIVVRSGIQVTTEKIIIQ